MFIPGRSVSGDILYRPLSLLYFCKAGRHVSSRDALGHGGQPGLLQGEGIVYGIAQAIAQGLPR